MATERERSGKCERLGVRPTDAETRWMEGACGY